MSKIEVKNLSVNYIVKKKNIVNALDNFSVCFEDGKINVLLGLSGCGKTTLLRAICRQFDYDGDIYFDGRNTSSISNKDLNIAYVDQKLFLFSHMIVYDILAFPLKQKHLKSQDIDMKVKDMAYLMGISLLLTRKPDQLSLGQRQKVSLGKALIKDPDIILLDEPFSNLSEEDKNEIIPILKNYVSKNHATVVYATHSLRESLKFGDQIFIMTSSNVEFSGSGQDVIDNLDNEYIQYLKESDNKHEENR